MFTSFSTALSALNATSTAVDVVGNNLANLNTPGFKTNVVYFRDLVTQSLGAGLGETQVGFRYRTAVDHPPVHPGRDSIEHRPAGRGGRRVTDSSSPRTPRATLCTHAPAISRWTTPAT